MFSVNTLENVLRLWKLDSQCKSFKMLVFLCEPIFVKLTDKHQHYLRRL